MTTAVSALKAPAAGSWSSRLMFVTAAAGSAVGLGNIWKFPYIVGENGGGAFVLVYLGCLALLGLPILIAEIMIGRRGGDRPSTAFLAAARAAGLSGRWRLVGALGATTSLLVLSFYAVITGWVLLYGFDYAALAIGQGSEVLDSEAHFSRLTGDARAQVFALLIVASAAFAFSARNAAGGVEAVMRWMGPAFAVLLFLLAAYTALAHPAPFDVVRYLLAPDFAALKPAAFGEAVGHAFFTLSIGLCGMVVYGAYLDSNASVPTLALAVATIDTIVSMLCAFIVLGVAFATGADPAQGPGLIFVILPRAFSAMPFGHVVGAAFFAAAFMAAFTSVIALAIIVSRAIEETFGATTRVASAITALATLSGGTVVVGSVSGAAPIRLFGAPLLDALDAITSSVLLPVSGILIAVFAARALAAEIRGLPFGRALLFCLRWVAPLALCGVAASRLL